MEILFLKFENIQSLKAVLTCNLNKPKIATPGGGSQQKVWEGNVNKWMQVVYKKELCTGNNDSHDYQRLPK